MNETAAHRGSSLDTFAHHPMFLLGFAQPHEVHVLENHIAVVNSIVLRVAV
eukprot:COSAG02_NODE_51869_length_311_cov_0.962264_1_plen_50_part_10